MTYEKFGELQIGVYTNEDRYIESMARNIPFEKMESDDDKDDYERCRELNGFWRAYSDRRSEETLLALVEETCRHLERTLGIPVKWEKCFDQAML